MDMKRGSIAPSLVESVTDYDLNQITPDLAELALDSILEDGIIKEIPVVKSFMALYKQSVACRDRGLVKKIVKFLESLNSVSPESKRSFRAKMNVDKEFRYEVGEKLLFILDRLDDMKKPNLVAHAFQAYLEEKINYDMFQRLSSAIDRTFFSDLKIFKQKRNANNISPQTKLELSNSGVIELKSMRSINLSSKNNVYQITEIGRLMLDIVLSD